MKDWAIGIELFIVVIGIMYLAYTYFKRVKEKPARVSDLGIIVMNDIIVDLCYNDEETINNRYIPDPNNKHTHNEKFKIKSKSDMKVWKTLIHIPPYKVSVSGNATWQQCNIYKGEDKVIGWVNNEDESLQGLLDRTDIDSKVEILELLEAKSSKDK